MSKMLDFKEPPCFFSTTIFMNSLPERTRFCILEVDAGHRHQVLGCCAVITVDSEVALMPLLLTNPMTAGRGDTFAVRGLPHKCEDLSLIQAPAALQEVQHDGASYNPSTREGSRHRQIPGAHWLVNLAKLLNFRPERPAFREKSGAPPMFTGTAVEVASGFHLHANS